MSLKSPFPGMDPYLERHWRDVHTSMVCRACEMLNRVLPPDLAARSDAREYIEEDGRPVRDSEPVTENLVTILELQGERTITVIEFLSPDNKKLGDEGHRAYLRTRKQFSLRETNLVEINLSRRGDWTQIIDVSIPPAIHQVYCALARRTGHAARSEFYPIPFRERLPVISVPLRRSEPDAHLDLQDLVDNAYLTGRYGSTDYTRPCDFSPQDAVWLKELLTDRR